MFVNISHTISLKVYKNGKQVPIEMDWLLSVNNFWCIDKDVDNISDSGKKITKEEDKQVLLR